MRYGQAVLDPVRDVKGSRPDALRAGSFGSRPGRERQRILREIKTFAKP